MSLLEDMAAGYVGSREIHAITEPNTSAITVAASDTVRVLSMICGYCRRPLKLSTP